MIKPIMIYTGINEGHSVGQELEYLLIKEGKVYDFIDLFAQELKLSLPWLNRKINSPKVYIDSWHLELCSSPHTNISDLYEEMAELYDAMSSKAKNKGLDIVKSSIYHFHNLAELNDTITQVAGSHVHIGNPWLTRNKLLDALTPYLPIFIALANNSPTEDFPKGSERLRNGLFSKDLEKNKDRRGRAIHKHKNAPTIEVRCLDRAKTLEEDIANAAFVYATAEKLKEDIRFFNFSQNLMNDNFCGLYLTNGRFNQESLLTFTKLLMQRATNEAFDANIDLRAKNNFSQKTLRDVTKQHYANIKNKLHEIHTPKHLIKILERKIL
ncbi:MAG: hypothetical protein KKF52_00985 [Nanoarchaeota archaeon]|nr:hypothetical protein [Nanoarchaeota archaeon]MBU4241783.1 hypothetical protein [Nanoarchaeota archaeon]MBU4352793.1 hypothetical protein [Nanoarchaeota archaeon]MCG2720027.1 hypothetical protein [Nanoarchaeota archaeon]